MKEDDKKEFRLLIQALGAILLIVAGSVLFGADTIAIVIGVGFMLAGVVIGILALAGKVMR